MMLSVKDGAHKPVVSKQFGNKMNELYLKVPDDVVKKHLLHNELSKRRFEDIESLQSKASHIIVKKKLLKIIEHRPKRNKFPLFLTPKERLQMKNACVFSKMMMDWKFNYSYFYKELCAYPFMPLEFLWKLNVLGIMSLDTFFSKILHKPKIVSAFCKSIVALCSMELQNVNDMSSLVSGMLVYIVKRAFTKDDDNTKKTEINKICHIIVNCILKRVIMSKRTVSEKMRLPSILLLWNAPLLESATLSFFCTGALNFILKYSFNIKTTQAISEQCNWTYKAACIDFVSVAKKILTVLEPSNVSSTLRDAVISQDVNWKSLLVVTSTFLTCCKEAPSYLLSTIDWLLKDAFDKLDNDCLFSCFLLARQIALGGPPLFAFSYCGWFQKSFGNVSTTYANNESTFAFLMKFLTSIVPHEPAEYLKVHIDNPPYIVNKCRSIFIDYASLAKTRLCDLKPKEEPESILDKLLSSFQATGKIPPTILEASIFHKQHFITEFLPNLLTPRVLPKTPDTKMKFIKALKEAGKIPKDMYEKYEKSCSSETKRKLDVLLMEDSIEEDSMEPGKHLTVILEKFQRQLAFYSKDAKENILLRDSLAELRGKLQLILKQLIRPNSEINDIIILPKNSKNVSHLKIVENILSCYCCFQYTVREVDNSLAFMWDLAADLLNFPGLHKALYLLIWKKIINSNMIDNELEGLVMCLLTMGLLHLKYPPILYSHDDSGPTLLSIAIFNSLKVTNTNQILYLYRFSYLYLKHVTSHLVRIGQNNIGSPLPIFVPLSLVKKFQFTALRLNPMLRNEPPGMEPFHHAVNNLYKSNMVQHWISISKLTLTELLKYEAQIIPKADHFQAEERSRFIHWCVQHLFMTPTDSIPEIKGLARCSCLFRILLSKNDQCPSFSQLLLILREIVPGLLVKESLLEANSTPWLLGEFNAVIKRFDSASRSYSMQISFALKKCLRVACELPQYMILGNSPYLTNVDAGLQELSKLINNWLRLYGTEGFFLTSSFTGYVVKGLLYMLYNCKKEEFKKKDESVKKFLIQCPFLTFSLVKHRLLIQNVCASMLPNKESCLTLLLGEIRLLLTWSTGLTCSENETLKLPPLRAIPKWFIGLSIMTKIAKFQANAVHAEIFAASLQFHIALKVALYPPSQILKSPTSDVITRVKQLLRQKQGKYFEPKNYNQSSLKEILPPSSWHHFPAGCLRVLLLVFSENELKKIGKKLLSTWLSLLLLNLTECNTNYQRRSTVDFNYFDVTNEEDIHKKRFGILDLDFIEKSTEKIKNIICGLPLNVFPAISQDIIQESDAYIKCCLRPRTKKKIKAKKNKSIP